MDFFTWHDITTGSHPLTQPSVLCIGAFDGPHKGHRDLFDSVLAYADGQQLASGVVTFSTPPKAVNDPSHFSGCLSTLEQKKEYFAKAGFQFLVVIDFTEEIKTMDGLAFLECIRKAFDIRCLFSGQDFRCGYRAATGFQQISDFCRQNHMAYQVIADTKAIGAGKVSSTGIRQCIAAGDFSLARELLGYDWVLDLRGLPVTREGTIDRSAIIQVLPAEGLYPCMVNGEISANLEITTQKVAIHTNPLTFVQNFANIVFV